MTQNTEKWYRVERPILEKVTEIYYIKAFSEREACDFAEFSVVNSWNSDCGDFEPAGDYTAEEMPADEVPSWMLEPEVTP
jgi:hypothetical protein